MILEGVLCIMRYIKDVVDLMSRAKYIENPSFDAYLIKEEHLMILNLWMREKPAVYIYFASLLEFSELAFMLAIRIITFFFSFLYLESMLHISFWRITTKKKQVCKINGAEFSVWNCNVTLFFVVDNRHFDDKSCMDSNIKSSKDRKIRKRFDQMAIFNSYTHVWTTRCLQTALMSVSWLSKCICFGQCAKMYFVSKMHSFYGIYVAIVILEITVHYIWDPNFSSKNNSRIRISI